MNALRRISNPFPIVLLAAQLVAFGGLLPWLGFYWDDWPSIWFLHFLGPEGFSQVFAADRPLLGWLFQLTTSVLGEQPLAWQLFAIAARALASLAFWQVLRLAFPEQPVLARWTALLFALYPGFGQQFIAVTYSHVFLLQALFLYSLAWMLKALQPGGRRIGWLVLSLLSAGLGMFTVEYFFGLELLRPLLIWRARDEPQPARRLKRTALNWAPYLLLLAAFLTWRVALSKTPRGQVTLFEDLETQPTATIGDLLLDNVLPDLAEAGALAWGRALLDAGQTGPGPAQLTAVAAALALGFLAGWWAWRSAQAEQDRPGGAGAALLLGGLGLLAGGWPFWATNLPIDLRFPWDRFTLAMMPGASLLAGGLLGLAGRWRRLPALIFGGMVALALAAHFQSALSFRSEWNSLKAFLWQLAWRAPSIQPGTLLITSELPFEFFSDNSLTAPLNWMYAPDSFDPHMPYALADLESRLGRRIPELQAGVGVRMPYRAATFEGSTSQALVLTYTPPGCLKLYDPARDQRLPQKPRYIAEALALSRPELAAASKQSARPPTQSLGKEPPAGWCTYFEQAELAVQYGEWAQAAALGERALALDIRLYEVQAAELLPYIEANAHIESWARAGELTAQAQQLNRRLVRSLCDAWGRIRAETPSTAAQQQAIAKVQAQLACPEAP